MNEKQQEMVAKNYRLVHYVVRKMGISQFEYDDIVSVGTVGLIKAVSTFDETKSIKFATYASRCITNEILMHYRKEKKHLLVTSLDAPINIDFEGNELTLADVIPDCEEDCEEQIELQDTFCNIINFILNVLRSKQRTVTFYSMAGLKQAETAEKLNVSQSYVSRLEERAHKKIKEFLSKTQKFEEVFKMYMEDGLYKITFSSKDVKNFNKIFSSFIRDLNPKEDLINYQVSCNSNRVIIIVPSTTESFEFIAKLMEAIEDFTLKSTKIDDKEKQELFKSNLSTEKERSLKSASSELEVITEAKGSKSKIIRDFILSVEKFTVKELKEKFTFPNANSAIANTIRDCKNKGLIVSCGKGTYSVKK